MRVSKEFDYAYQKLNCIDPDEEPRATVLGWKYPEQAPFGFNGAFYYMKLSMDL